MGSSNINGRPLDPTSRRSPAGEIVISPEVPGSGGAASLPDLTDVSDTVTPGKGSVLVGDGSLYREQLAGLDGQVLVYDSSQPTGVRAATIAAVGRDSLVFGAGSVLSSTRTRYLYAGYSDRQAELAPIQVPSPRTGVIQDLRIFQNIPGAGSNPITYRIRVGGVGTSLNVVLAANALSGATLGSPVPVLAGQGIDIEVTKALPIGASPDNIVAIVEVL